jgi:hypothetical protein
MIRSSEMSSMIGNRNRLLTLMLAFAVLGCRNDVPSPAPQTVLFDRASRQAIVVEAVAEFPALHPQTGQPTLVPAMYCSQCAAWRPVPPPEEVNRMKTALKCSKCRGPLVTTGPFPNGT